MECIVPIGPLANKIEALNLLCYCKGTIFVRVLKVKFAGTSSRHSLCRGCQALILRLMKGGVPKM